MSELISEGPHTGKCTSMEIRFSRNGTEHVACVFKLTDPDDAFFGYTIHASLWVTDKALKHTVKSLRLLGWQGKDMGELPELCAAGKLGNEVKLIVEHDEWDGRKSAKVKFINANEKPLDKEARAQFGARLKDAIERIESGAEDTVYAAPTAADEGDLPFATSSISADSPLRHWRRWP